VTWRAPYIPPAFTDRRTEPEGFPGRGKDRRHFTYELCRSIDITHLGVTLDEMVKAGRMDAHLAELYRTQASALLATLLSENNREK
jgi:hypothetical protein